jgi:hypothetical protein
MLSGKVLNTAATLNNFKEVKGQDFMLNDAFTLVFRIIDPQLGDRYIPPSTAIITLIFSNFDTTSFVEVATPVDVNDRSMQSVSLATTDTAQLYGGNIPFTVDLLGDGTHILYGVIPNALRKVAEAWGPNGE